MRNKRVDTIRFSQKATGITPIKTKVSKPVNGVKTQVIAGDILIRTSNNTLSIEYRVDKLDSAGNRIEGYNPVLKPPYFIRDEPAEGTIEVNENGEEIEGTFEETKPEKLSLTDWNNREIYIKDDLGNYLPITVGQLFCGTAIQHLEMLENIK